MSVALLSPALYLRVWKVDENTSLFCSPHRALGGRYYSIDRYTTLGVFQHAVGYLRRQVFKKTSIRQAGKRTRDSKPNSAVTRQLAYEQSHLPTSTMNLVHDQCLSLERDQFLLLLTETPCTLPAYHRVRA